MISFIALALANLASPSSPTAAPAALYANDTVAHMKGHLAIPARKAPAHQDSTRSAAPTVCNSDPMKGRACRHHVAQTEQARAEAAPMFAVRDGR